MFPPLAITAFGGPEGYFSLAIITFGFFVQGFFLFAEPLKSLEKEGKSRKTKTLQMVTLQVKI